MQGGRILGTRHALLYRGRAFWTAKNNAGVADLLMITLAMFGWHRERMAMRATRSGTYLAEWDLMAESLQAYAFTSAAHYAYVNVVSYCYYTPACLHKRARHARCLQEKHG